MTPQVALGEIANALSIDWQEECWGSTSQCLHSPCLICHTPTHQPNARVMFFSHFLIVPMHLYGKNPTHLDRQREMTVNYF
jgi:hypothetical protein